MRGCFVLGMSCTRGRFVCASTELFSNRNLFKEVINIANRNLFKEVINISNRNLFKEIINISKAETMNVKTCWLI